MPLLIGGAWPIMQPESVPGVAHRARPGAERDHEERSEAPHARFLQRCRRWRRASRPADAQPRGSMSPKTASPAAATLANLGRLLPDLQTLYTVIHGHLDRRQFADPVVRARCARLDATNHNPRLAPVIHPTLATDVEALVVAARAWLAA
jgi:hypothetical protein